MFCSLAVPMFAIAFLKAGLDRRNTFSDPPSLTTTKMACLYGGTAALDWLLQARVSNLSASLCRLCMVDVEFINLLTQEILFKSATVLLKNQIVCTAFMYCWIPPPSAWPGCGKPWVKSFLILRNPSWFCLIFGKIVLQTISFLCLAQLVWELFLLELSLWRRPAFPHTFQSVVAVSEERIILLIEILSLHSTIIFNHHYSTCFPDKYLWSLQKAWVEANLIKSSTRLPYRWRRSQDSGDQSP